MPTADQLATLPQAVDGDGSNSEHGDDGSTTTSWPDGTVRVDYADRSSTVTFSDFAVLNVAADGSRTLNDRNGAALDPTTGQPLGGVPVPSPLGPDAALKALNGEEPLADVQQAIDMLKTFEDALAGELNPAEWAIKVLESVLEVVKAVETEERGVQLRAWCYAVLYGALDMGTPPEPTFSGSLGGEAQDGLDLQAWRDGVAAGQAKLAEGAAGISVRNRVLLRVAQDGGAPAGTVNALWQAACAQTDDDKLLQAYPNLSWPQPIGA